MAKYIDMDAYIKYLSSRIEDFADDYGRGWRAGIVTAIWSCKKFSTDAVHVVRCRQCRYSYYGIYGLVCSCVDDVVSEDFYCKHGEYDK